MLLLLPTISLVLISISTSLWPFGARQPSCGPDVLCAKFNGITAGHSFSFSLLPSRTVKSVWLEGEKLKSGEYRAGTQLDVLLNHKRKVKPSGYIRVELDRVK